VGARAGAGGSDADSVMSVTGSGIAGLRCSCFCRFAGLSSSVSDGKWESRLLAIYNVG